MFSVCVLFSCCLFFLIECLHAYLTHRLLKDQQCCSLRTLAWVTLGVSFYVLLHVGTLYGFSAYSAQLQTILDVEGSKVALVGAFGDAGAFGSITVALFQGYFGQSWTSLLGGMPSSMPLFFHVPSNLLI